MPRRAPQFFTDEALGRKPKRKPRPPEPPPFICDVCGAPGWVRYGFRLFDGAMSTTRCGDHRRQPTRKSD